MIATLVATALLGRPTWSVVGDRFFAALPKKGAWTRQTFVNTAKKIGLESSPHAPPFRLGGSSSWVVCFHDKEDAAGMAFQIGRDGAKPLCPINYNQLLPLSGFVDRDRVVLGGVMAWYGNGPNPGACIVKNLKVLQSVDVDFEGWDCFFDNRVAKVRGRTYPSVINVCHAMANVEMVGTITYRRGRLVVDSPRRTMNPMAILDDLSRAAAHRDYHAIRRLTTTDQLARAVATLGIALKEAGWQVPGSVCSIENTVYDAQPLGRRLTFVRSSGAWKLGKIETIQVDKG